MKMRPLQHHYYLIAVANRKNLELCIHYALAGFSSSLMGAWAFVELQEGDFVSFLYGARVFNLYEVAHKEAWLKAEDAPPWELITFRSGLTYYFPFRVWLKPVREFNEPLVRAEFAYVAENLLLRGGYRKTHFQADFTTLQYASQLGTSWQYEVAGLDYTPNGTFEPMFVRRKSDALPLFRWHEVILQAAIKQLLQMPEHLHRFVEANDLPFKHGVSVEVLSEKALPQGHIDLLLKDAVPIARATKVPVEVKLGRAGKRDLDQLRSYMNELDECSCGVLVAADFPKVLRDEAWRRNIGLMQYTLNLDLTQPKPFITIVSNLNLVPMGG